MKGQLALVPCQEDLLGQNQLNVSTVAWRLFRINNDVKETGREVCKPQPTPVTALDQTPVTCKDRPVLLLLLPTGPASRWVFFFKAVPMASITVDMLHVDQDIADSEAANIWEYVSDILAAGATHDEMLVALGMVIEKVIGDADRHNDQG